MKRVASLFLSCFNHMDNNNENCCDDDTKKALCFALCRVLTRSNHLPLLQSCCQALSSSLLKPYFHSILLDQANGTSKGMVYSTAASILVSSNHKEEEEEIVQLFLKCTVHKFASHDTIVPLARPFLSTLSQTIIDTLIVPTCELKLRANPEASLETIHAILSCLENGLQEEATQNLTALAIKQFKSSKPHMKLLATQFLVQVTRLSSSCTSIVTQLCNALSSTQKTTVTLTQPDQRLAAYTVLNNIGIFLLDDSTKLPTHELSNAVLKSICTVLVKDISGSESQIQGFYTLLTWMLLSKQQKQSKDGYTDAIQYLKQIIMDASKPSNNDFRHLFGFLVQAPWNCTQHLDQEFVKTILVDLFQSSGVVLKACEAMIELGEKKFAKSDAVPQIDAVLATYLILVYTEASSSTSKLSSVVEKVILSGKFATTAKNKLSFLYASSIMTITATNSLMGHLCPIILALSTKLTSSSSNLFRLIVKYGNPTKVSAATHLLACCIANPHHIKQPKQGISTITVYSAMDTILNYSPSSNFVADALISALTSHVNATSLEYSKKMNEINQSPDQQPSPTVGAIRGKYSPTAGHKGLDCNIIRRVAMNLLTKTTNSDCCVKAILLSHVGSTLKVIKSRQRNALVAATSRILSSLLDDENETKQKEVRNKLCQLIVTCASSSTISNSFLHDITTITTSATSKDEEKEGPSTDSEQDDEEEEISQVIYESTLSLMSSLSIMGGGFDPAYDDVDDVEKEIIFARTLCVDELGPLLSTKLQQTLVQIESLKDNEIQLYRSVHGIVFNNDNDRDSSTASIEPSSKSKTSSQKSSTSRSSSSSSKKKKGGMSFGEDEWESQMKKEIAAKKKKKQQTTKDTSMDVQEKKLLELQKRKVARLVDGDFHHVLRAIQTLCNADVEIGNACLPALSTPVLAAAVSHDILLPCCKDACIHTLSILASCVYEIEEDGNNNLTKALLHSCTRKSTENDNSQLVTITPLSSSTAAASVIQYVMDEYDDTLSKSSFFFLFPILRAALMGPKPCVGCEGALLILNRHAVISDIVVELRKEMALSVLELIRHDRAQTFLDPTPFDTLVAIYTSTFTDDNNVKISASELGPLLGDIGALCPTNNNRCASMKALASLSQHQSLNLNRNPLVENRIWLNCFSTNQQIRDYAKEAFSSDRPSKLFVVPMLPLLSNENAEIASMAADALATGMTLHLDTMEKNMIRLCNLYIDSYPTVFDDKTTGTPSTTNTASPPANLLSKPLAETKSSISSSSTTKKTKSISTGLPKKTKIKSSSKGSSSIAALTTTKKKPSSKKVRAALAPKPQERTVDLAAQFQSKSVQMSATVERDNPEKIQVRRGVLRAIASITNNTTANSMEVFPFTVLELLVRFLSAYCLADGNEKVRDEARNATRDAVATHGGTSQAIAFLLPHFETVLSTGKADVTASLSSDKVHTTSAAANRRKEGVVVALGSVALHLEENDDKIDTTLDMLLDALLQPTSTIAVQSSIALCLSKLMKKKRAKTRIPDMIQHLLNVCLNDTSPKIRRGGAYGLSAVVKGSGIATLKKDNIVPQLQQAITGQKTECKEGALLAIEQFSSRLGLLFEPYVIVLLPSLLKAFSDNATSVRDAAAKAAGFIMSRLSAHGVKLVMPAVLSAFDEPEWRTKQASIHMLGAMSHCAPKQLASCLPKVVPKLTEAFSDTHPKVKASAQEALDEISTVIRNPEISSIAKDLLKALTDPAQGTVVALESLIETEFVHAIDAPSLALIVPVLHRGLRDRLATTKRYGALITGNICTMIQDPRDFVPYLSILLPDLKTVLLDPIPDVRSTSAKALGFLTRSLGEATFPDLRPWLIDTLRSEVGSSVERSGAAQGLTEVLTAGGPHLVQKVMTEEILPLKSYPQASTREGVLWVLTFLPTSSANFAPLIDASFPALIRGLSDESEPVRDVAMRAGRVIIRSHGKANLDKILPSLEEGLWDDDYRIRVASLMLLGDLLGMIGGITTNNRGGDGVDTQEDIRQAERAQAQIALVLGMETRRRVLSSLYMRRNDTAAVVRQNAIQVWKSVVSVTPRTLRDILQVLVGQIITALASGNPEQTEVAGRCLGDVVRKLGDAVLPEIVPVLRDSLLLYDDEDSVTTRRGACVGLSEVLTCSTKEQLEKYLDIFTKAVQNALCDDDEDVRELAASCFQTLYNTVGNRAFEQVVPVLLVAMGKQNHDEAASRRAIVGLTGILKIRSRDLLPYLIPRLLQKPITEAHANALGSIAQVTGSTIATFFSTILPSLLSELASSTEVEDAIRSCVQSICASVDETGIQTMVGEIASLINHSDNENIRVECSWTIQSIIEESKFINLYMIFAIIIGKWSISLLHNL